MEEEEDDDDEKEEEEEEEGGGGTSTLEARPNFWTRIINQEMRNPIKHVDLLARL